jgi:hypothetical protein
MSLCIVVLDSFHGDCFYNNGCFKIEGWIIVIFLLIVQFLSMTCQIMRDLHYFF